MSSPEFEGKVLTLLEKISTDHEARIRALENRHTLKTGILSFLTAVVTAVATVLASGCYIPEPQHPTPADKVEAGQATVKIHGKDPTDIWGAEWTGTGTFIEPDLILTAGHVCEPEAFYMAETSDGTMVLVAPVVDVDEGPGGDVCLMHTFMYDSPAVMDLADAPAQFGDKVWYVGYPYGYLNSYEGTASRVVLPSDGREAALVGYQGMSLAGYPGSSGSAVLNERGEVVGVIVMGVTDLMFATPLWQVKDALKAYNQGDI